MAGASFVQQVEVGYVGDLWLPLVALAAVGAILGGLSWLASRARRRGISGSMLGIFDEMYHPAAHESRIEIQVQKERKAPAPSPEDL